MGSLLALWDWSTPCSHYEPESIGDFHIVRRTIPKGTVLDVQAMSIDAVVFAHPIHSIQLREGIRDKSDAESIWMSDTPKEYYMTWELVARARGNVLVGGLGLGLLVHLLRNRRDIGNITVVEKSPEVVQMVSKYMPKDVTVIQDDFVYQVQKLSEQGAKFDTVIADMWKTGAEEEFIDDCHMVIDDCYPNALKLFWALQEELDNEESQLALVTFDTETSKRFRDTAWHVVRGSW